MNIKIVTTLLFLVLASLVNAGNVIKLELPTSLSGIGIKSDKFTLRGDESLPVILQKSESLRLQHKSRAKSFYTIAGMTGEMISDFFENGTYQLERQVWLSNDSKVVCIRNIVTNLLKKPINLKSISPLKISDKNFNAGSGNVENWKLLMQYRLKNERPIVIQPKTKINEKADPFFILNDETANLNLFIGYLSRKLHKASINIRFEEKNKVEFSSLETFCDFEGVELPPQAQRTSQWVYITSGKDGNDLIDSYANRVAIYNKIPMPAKNAPTVYCTWYYHAEKYNQQIFNHDIETFRKKNVPFDVFLIDDCWEGGAFGDFVANNQFPSGMKVVAKKIQSLGYIPGIWTPPFLVDKASKLAENYPLWLLKNNKGDRITFIVNSNEYWVLDLTYPGVCNYLEEKYRMLSRDWGYKYFKFDFMRSVFINPDTKFYDATKTSLEAYRMGLEAIQRGTGKDAYLNVCGGHYGASMGIANAQRSGSDVVSGWKNSEIPKYRQNILRTWMSRLWHVDPDAMMVRKSDLTIYPDRHTNLTIGNFTDEEAKTNALNQYIGGGLVSFTEDFNILSDSRFSLYKHVIPSVNSSSQPIDLFNSKISNYTLTKIIPKCGDLESWITIAAVNWSDEPMNMQVPLDYKTIETLHGNKYFVSEFFSQKTLGIFNPGDVILLGKVLPHQSKLVRITPWDGKKPVLANTDLHFSGGGVEIATWKGVGEEVSGTIQTQWNVPVKITVAFPDDNLTGYTISETLVLAGVKPFWVKKNP